MAWIQSMIVGGLFPRVLLDMGVGVAPTAIVDGTDFVTLIDTGGR